MPCIGDGKVIQTSYSTFSLRKDPGKQFPNLGSSFC